MIAEVAGGHRKLLLPGLHRLEHAAYLARRIAARLDRASDGRVETR